MRRLYRTLAVLFLPFLLGATIYYVDGGCPNNGVGNPTDCSATAGGAGAYNNIQSALSGMAAGDTIFVRGAHATHGSNHGRCSYTKAACTTVADCPSTGIAVGITQTCDTAFDGAYFRFGEIMPTVCTSIAGCTIKAYNWTTKGDGEEAYMISARPASNAWTVCNWNGSSCDAPCAGLTQTPCQQTWYVTDSGTAPANFENHTAAQVRAAIKSDMTPTYRVASLGALTNANGGYNAARCSIATWRPCTAASDCPESGSSCTAGASPEIDSYRDSVNSRLFVRWGTTLPARPYVTYDPQSGLWSIGMDMSGSVAYWTIQGLTYLYHRTFTILNPGAHDISFTDIKTAFTHCFDGCDGGSRGIDFNKNYNISAADCEFGWSSDEGVHAIGRDSDAATTLTLQRNWFHHQGSEAIVGNIGGTPSAILLGDDNSTSTSDNFTGTDISNNLIEYQTNNDSAGYPLRIETASGWKFHDNIITNQTNSGAMCITLGHAANNQNTPVDSNEIYNNLMIGCPQGGIEFHSANASGSCSSNLVYNNTFIDVGTSSQSSIYTSYTAGTMASNLIRNNIFYSSGSVKQINWTNTDATNLFEYNDVFTAAATAATWLNVGYSCANINGGTMPGTDANICADPVFTSASDFHIQTSSPCKDTGTATGMPSARTTDITNTQASGHGLAAYDDADSIQNSVWDMGIDEFVGAAATARPVMVISTLRQLPCP